MSIRFACERCGHPMEVDDHFAGKHGHCKHCGHATVVPAPGANEPARPMRLRPLQDDEEAGAPHEEPHRPRAPRAAESTGPYRVVEDKRSKGRAGPPRLHGHPIVRFELATLRTLRNWLYVVSVLFLIVTGFGFFFKIKPALHFGAVAVIATNIAMLVVGVGYLILIPFKEGLVCGLLNLLPPYTLYYWVTRWPTVRTAFWNTVGSFLPIALAAGAYFAYTEGPAIEREVEREVPVIEKKLEGLEKVLPKTDEAPSKDSAP